MVQEDAGYQFVPLTVEAYGHLGRAAVAFLALLGDVAASAGHVSMRPLCPRRARSSPKLGTYLTRCEKT
jgi:hypothetical protein